MLSDLLAGEGRDENPCPARLKPISGRAEVVAVSPVKHSLARRQLRQVEVSAEVHLQWHGAAIRQRDVPGLRANGGKQAGRVLLLAPGLLSDSASTVPRRAVAEVAR